MTHAFRWGRTCVVSLLTLVIISLLFGGGISTSAPFPTATKVADAPTHVPGHGSLQRDTYRDSGEPNLYPPIDPMRISEQYHPNKDNTALQALDRGSLDDLWADIIIGKPRFSEVSPFTTVSNKLFWSHGAIVDRTSPSNKLYVYDSGNNRVLGLDLERCVSRPGDPLGCPADIVIGQPDMYHSGCNGDSGFQGYPNRAPASAGSLCGQQEGQLSIAEGGSGSSMATDAQGNLYVTDFFNHRVLKYNAPFLSDSVADDVWGQNDYTGNSCNRGNMVPDATSLCFSWGSTNNWTAGVEIDLSGNLWVVDSGNNRVLRFPAGSHVADLVLGQPSFTSREPGAQLQQLRDPAAVRVNGRGWVYVADQGNHRVLVYEPPFSSGMAARSFGSGFSNPSGIDFDPVRGGIWVINTHNQQWPPPNTLERWDEDSQTMLQMIGRPNAGPLMWASGSIGIDSQGNIYTTQGWIYPHDTLIFAHDGLPTAPSKRIFGSTVVGNQITAQGIAYSAGVVVKDNQLISADYGRLIFWNDPASLSNGQPAAGVAGGVTAFDQRAPGCCLKLKADDAHHLWASLGDGPQPDHLEVYALPLINGARPIVTMTFPLPVLGGGHIDFAPGLTNQPFWGVAPAANSEVVWISHKDTNRVFRVRDPLTSPMVDVILGQDDINGINCNRGAPPVTGATLNSLCAPGSLSLDRQGNLWVSDHSLERNGNMRLLAFNSNLFPVNNPTPIFAPNATKVFPNTASWETAFDSRGRMVTGYNPYWGSTPGGGWFPGVYLDPLGPSVQPDFFINDYHSNSFALTFDEQDNLYIGDLNRSRVLIYKHPIPAPAQCPQERFKDVCPGTYYYEPVQRLSDAGIISGYGTPTCNYLETPCFKPFNAVTRGQVSKMVSLAAAFGDPVTGQSFEDVPSSNTFYLYIERMAIRGIIGGYSCGGPSEPCGPGDLPYFRPGSNVTRGQLSKMASLAFGFIEPVSGQRFQDVPPGSSFYEYVERMVARNIISGYPCGSPGEPCVGPNNRPYFRPNNSVTRGQTAKMIYLGWPPTPTPTSTATITPTATPTCGPAWHIVHQANYSGEDELWDIEQVSPTDAWAVGGWTDVYEAGQKEHDWKGFEQPNTTNPLTMRWDGSSWTMMPITHTWGELRAVEVVSANDVWAAGTDGDTLTMHWNGVSWSRVPSPNPGPAWNVLHGLKALGPNDVWAVGAQSTPTGAEVLVLRWNGSVWNVVPITGVAAGYNELYEVDGSGPNDVWAVGYGRVGGAWGSQYPLAAHWNGSNWSITAVPLGSNSFLNDVSVLTPSEVWAAGSGVVRWNGSQWSVSLQYASGTEAIEAIASNDVWAAGDTMRHWNGAIWNIVTMPDPGGGGYLLRSITRGIGTEKWAAGFSGQLGSRTPLIERYYAPCAFTPVPLPTQSPTSTGTPTPVR